ncbi:uncharacterized protein A4U43_C02F4760 [Asparagus officinalis]|uniref:Uncharacterized protein n=1 Tax=Asparagus officinalis TaxID=4686 RepID=A0A5P1FGR9_ASPOF|nr:uncharacterized protein LOC109829389 [Asparagus officinalis]ONK77264.1 uncharacterized protein A4U43_C02F4760 [Asparagus officinalis]
MGFNGCNESDQQAKRAPPPRARSAVKSSNHDDSSNHRRKGAAVFPESEVEKFDNTKEQSNFIQKLSDGSNFMLASICKSPDSRDVCWNLNPREHFSSILSLSGSDVSFDGHIISPADEASFVLDRLLQVSDGGDSEEEVAVWLHNPPSAVVTSSSVCSENGDSSNNRSSCDDSSPFETSSTSLSTLEETPLFVRDFDRMGIWVSSLDLDAEDSDFVHETGRGSDVSDSDFPSPSIFSARQKYRYGSSSLITSFVQTEEIGSSSEMCDSDEPLFWPFDEKSYWLPEFEKNFLRTSPRKGVKSLKPARLKNDPRDSGKSIDEKKCRRRLAFGPRAKAPAGKHNVETSIDENTQNISEWSPSGLSKSHQTSINKCPCSIEITERAPLSDVKSQIHTCNKQLQDVPLPEPDSTNLHVSKEVSIEKMVGLNEFDGHEGLSVESEEECTLKGSPFKMMIS